MCRPWYPDETGRILAEVAELEQIGRQHGVGVAARPDPPGCRVPGRTCATRSRVHRCSNRDSSAKTKNPSAPSSCAERCQSLEIRGERIQTARIADRHEQPRAAFARDARGHDLVQLGGRQRSASATRSVVLNGSGLSRSAAVWRNSMTGSRSGGRAAFLCAHLDDTGSGMLAHAPERRRPRASRTAWAAIVACPTKGASFRALKNRSATGRDRRPWRRERRPLRHGQNSRAIDIRVASLCPSASRTTIAGLPVKRVRVNAST